MNNNPTFYFFKIQAEILEALSVFDREDTGFLDRATVENLIRHLGEGLDEAEVEEFVGSLSYDGDGKISHEEFLKVVLNENWNHFETILLKDNAMGWSMGGRLIDF